jgi:ankyrin repeat protein
MDKKLPTEILYKVASHGLTLQDYDRLRATNTRMVTLSDIQRALHPLPFLSHEGYKKSMVYSNPEQVRLDFADLNDSSFISLVIHGNISETQRALGSSTRSVSLSAKCKALSTTAVPEIIELLLLHLFDDPKFDPSIPRVPFVGIGEDRCINEHIVHWACFHGKIGIFSKLLEYQRVSVLAEDDDQMRPIHFAAYGGQLGICKLLLSFPQVNINQRDAFRRTPLHYAVAHYHLSTVEYLFSQPSLNVYAIDSEGWNALHFAAFSGSSKMVLYLLDNSPLDPTSISFENEQPLNIALNRGFYDVVIILCHRLIRFTNFNPFIVDEKNTNLLHVAAKCGDVILATFFLSCIDPSERKFDGVQPLHEAAAEGHVEIVKLLLADLSVDASSCDGHEWDALHYAVARGHLKVIQVLLNHRKSR